ncbi:CBS domain-containing protein [Gordonia amicalis]|uniref:CBS domain-containing protein n=1 Tax=Gordonia amicalis TaxID=89053 RepID=UPI001EE065F0|nr:CBS domain-containing protein [Gordonia amicalis]MDV7101303.1 CBS domain-containing protein [Gordonia amicalis]MDV7173690.1 CBS domain-containing protein [Gordonia amicalis]UKO93665.1 CBS domain-containing protein [Gordonia amicalis]UOG21312.1 CBS domain-containing protein [Gordonia amicalis]
MRVHDVMVRPVVTVSTDTPVRRAAVTLTERGFAALPVLDHQQRLAGVLTSGDVLRAGESGPDVTVSEVMSTPPVAVAGHQDLTEVVRMLLGHGVRSLPVLDAEGQVQGMFSRGDALRLMLRPDETISAAAQVRLDDYFGPRRWFALARDGAVTVTGTAVGESERRIAIALVRTVPGVREVTLATRSSCG